MAIPNQYSPAEKQMLDELYKATRRVLENVSGSGEAAIEMDRAVKDETKELNSITHAKHNVLLTMANEAGQDEPTTANQLWYSREGARRATIIGARFQNDLNPVLEDQLSELKELRLDKLAELSVSQIAQRDGKSIIYVTPERVVHAFMDEDKSITTGTARHSNDMKEIEGIVRDVAFEADKIDCADDIEIRYDATIPDDKHTLSLPWEKSPGLGNSMG